MIAILLIPLIAAALLAAIPNYRVSADLNVVASLLSLLAAITLLFHRPAPASTCWSTTSTSSSSC